MNESDRENNAARGRQRARNWFLLGVTLSAALSVATLAADAWLRPALGFRQSFTDLAAASGSPRVERITRRVDLSWLEEDPTLPRRHFHIRWEGVWHIADSRWIDLYAGADDRVTITIDGTLLLERNPQVGMGYERRRFPLDAGDHHLVIDFEQIGGDYGLRVSTGLAGGVPHDFARESVFPSTPGRRTLSMVRRVTWLRRSAVLAWVLTVVGALYALAGRSCLRAARQASLSWVARCRVNWRRWRDESESPARQTRTSINRAIAAAYVLTMVAGLAMVGRHYDARDGFTSFISFGEQFAGDALPAVRAAPHYVAPKSPGYDGQFYAQLAVEPDPRSAELAQALDSMPYRARRILFAWSAFALGLGHPAWVLQAYAVQNVISWTLLAWLLCRWLPPSSLRNWAAWFACLFALGMISSVRLALTDGPSVMLLALAVAASERGRWLAGAAIVGIAGLGRETNLIGAGACLGAPRSGRLPRVRLLLSMVLVAAPLLIWLTYLGSLLGVKVWTGGGANLTLPFTGLIGKVSTAVQDVRMHGWTSLACMNALVLVTSTVQVACLLWRAEWQVAWWRVGVPYALLGAVLAQPVWEGYPGAYVRVLLPMTIAFNVTLSSSRRFWLLFVAGNLSVIWSIQLLLEVVQR